MIQRRLLALVGVLLVAGSLAYVSWPVGHIPPYDADMVRLAESDLQGYCSGDTYWRSGGAGGAGQAAQCRQRLARTHSDRPDLRAVQTAFCQAVVDAGWEGGSLGDCLSILAGGQLWPTYDGALTDQWNRARPYPQTFGSSGGPSGRGGSRTGGHNGPSRTNNPTHRVPHY